MKNLGDIKYRIRGVTQTRQITNAMETISVAKMRRAMQKFNNNLTYFNRVRSAIRDIIVHSDDVEHRYWKPKANDRAVYIVIASDKGLAGGYNHNVLTRAYDLIKNKKEKYIFTVGQMAREFFERKKLAIDVEFMHVTYNPCLDDAVRIVENITNLYEKDFMDEVYVVYTALENSSHMSPEVIKLLPLSSDEIRGGAADDGKDEDFYKALYYDPSPEEVLETLVPQYLTGVLYGALIQSVAAEHSARVLAMSNATKNAGEIIRKLNTAYNKARQEVITGEMIEIITAAGAVG